MIQDLWFWGVLFVAAAVFWLLPLRVRPVFLATISLAYLFHLDRGVAALILFWGSVVYVAGVQMGKYPSWGKFLVPGIIVTNLGYLAYHKYLPGLLAALGSDAFSAQVVVPLGASYFTFRLIHYVVETGRGNIPRHSLAEFLAYLFLFPVFSAGPIERMDHYLENRDVKFNSDHLVHGLTRIVVGLIKKFIIIGMVLQPCFGSLTGPQLVLDHLSELQTYKIWGFLVLSFIAHYLDFSAYSDIAIGASRLFGIRIMENFNFPLFAVNIRDFWTRWHMTLTEWCRSYVYMPVVGLTRNPYLSIYSVFIVMGLWHAGSWLWLLWGLYHATGVCLNTRWARYKRGKRGLLFTVIEWRAVAMPLTLLFVSLEGVFTLVYGHGTLYDSLRLVAKLGFFDLPPGG